MSFSSDDKHTYGGGMGNFFIGEVVSRQDQLQKGRVQIAFLGGKQGEQGKDQSYWAEPMFGLGGLGGAPMNGGIGGPYTGLMERQQGKEGSGSHVIGFMGADGLPIVIGCVAASNKGEGEGVGKGRDHDGNKDSRDKDKEGGDYRFDPQRNDYADKSLTEFGYRESPNPHQRREPKESEYNPEGDGEEESWSAGQFRFED